MGKLLRGLWLLVVAVSRKLIPQTLENSPSSRDSPSTPFVGIITIPTSI